MLAFCLYAVLRFEKYNETRRKYVIRDLDGGGQLLAFCEQSEEAVRVVIGSIVPANI